jgi:hypothetical protein
MADTFALSPIRQLVFNTCHHSRADAFGAAVLRSKFRRRNCAAVLRRWFYWMCWKKHGSFSPHLDCVPTVVKQFEFHVAQTLKNVVAWFFISWSNYFLKKRKQKQMELLLSAISCLHILRSSTTTWHRMATFMKTHTYVLTKFSYMHRRCSISKSFRGFRVTWRAANLGRLYNSRLKIARFYHWKQLYKVIVQRWQKHYAGSLFVRCVRTWRISVRNRQVLIDFSSKAAAHYEATCLQETFLAWSTSHSKRLRLISLLRTRALNLSFHIWLFESVVRKNQRLLDVKVQNTLGQKRILSAIFVLASWARKKRVLCDSIVSKQLRQQFIGIKSTIFRTWAIRAFKKRNVAYQNSINKRIKMAVMRIINRAIVLWWIRMKQASRARVLQGRQLYKIKKMATASWRITTLTTVSHRSSNMHAAIRRRNRRLLVLTLPLWRNETQKQIRAHKHLLRLHADRFHLSRIFRAFSSNCRKQHAESALSFRRSVLKLHFNALWKQSQKNSMLECAQLLLTKMRTIRQIHLAVKHLKCALVRSKPRRSLKLTEKISTGCRFHFI